MRPRSYDKYGNKIYTGRGSMHTIVTPETKKGKGRWSYCNEDQRLVDKCLNCTNKKCNGDCLEFREFRRQLMAENKKYRKIV